MPLLLNLKNWRILVLKNMEEQNFCRVSDTSALDFFLIFRFKCFFRKDVFHPSIKQKTSKQTQKNIIIRDNEILCL